MTYSMSGSREPSTESCNCSLVLPWHRLDKITYLCGQVHKEQSSVVKQKAVENGAGQEIAKCCNLGRIYLLKGQYRTASFFNRSSWYQTAKSFKPAFRYWLSL